MGGVREAHDKVSKFTYLYNGKNNTVGRKANMCWESYAFCTLVKHPWVYAFGGRKSGDDKSILD